MNLKDKVRLKNGTVGVILDFSKSNNGEILIGFERRQYSSLRITAYQKEHHPLFEIFTKEELDKINYIEWLNPTQIIPFIILKKEELWKKQKQKSTGKEQEKRLENLRKINKES